MFEELKLITEAVSQIIQPVYAVGGCVRDSLLGLPPKDYDFTTPLLPDEIEHAAKAWNRHVYLTGKRFGTVGFKVNPFSFDPKKFVYVEVTTFRTEDCRKGGRHPEVTFVDDLSLDLNRRDFTINAMAYNPARGLIDPFNGQVDLRNRLIRTVGNPTHRFKEDPLRMLRAARFAAQLGARIDETAEKSCLKHSFSIMSVSRERWMQELDKLLLGVDERDGLEFLMKTRLFNFMIPELALQYHYDQHSPYHNLDLWEHTLRVVETFKAHNPYPSEDFKECYLQLAWACLLHDIGKPFVQTRKPTGQCNYIFHADVGAEIVTRLADYLHWSTDRKENISYVVKHHLEENSAIKYYDMAGKE
jgi:tRNA nucleotidyltransferase/poly(A) polymerase